MKAKTSEAVTLLAKFGRLTHYLKVILGLGVFLLLATIPTVDAQDGNLLWAKREGGASSDAGFRIAVDGSGISYVTGLFQGATTFGPGEANQTTLSSVGTDDIFVARYDSNGALLWAKRAGGTSGARGQAIAVDALGNS